MKICDSLLLEVATFFFFFDRFKFKKGASLLSVNRKEFIATCARTSDCPLIHMMSILSVREKTLDKVENFFKGSKFLKAEYRFFIEIII